MTATLVAYMPTLWGWPNEVENNFSTHHKNYIIGFNLFYVVMGYIICKILAC